MLARYVPPLARIRDRWSRATILMYHRVVDTNDDPWGLSVSPAVFADQLEWLRRNCTVLPMDAFVARMRSDTLPRNAVAITFDDGYHDNLLNAAPALAAARIPATVFLTTRPTCDSKPYWSDELAAMTLNAEEAADISVDLPDGPLAIRFGAREAADGDRHGWRAWETPRTQREAAHYMAWDRIRALRSSDADWVMTTLRAILPAKTNPADRAMTPDEIRKLVASGLITLGGHTANHADLPALTLEEAFEEITRGKAEAEAMIGAPLSGFAYPYGRCSQTVRDLAALAGFDWACTTEPGFVGASRTDSFAMPRIAAIDKSPFRLKDGAMVSSS